MKVADTHGFTLLPLSSHILSILANSPAKKNAPKQLPHELSCCYKYPMRLFVHEIEFQHFTAVHMHEHAILYFDSLHKINQ